MSGSPRPNALLNAASAGGAERRVSEKACPRISDRDAAGPGHRPDGFRHACASKGSNSRTGLARDLLQVLRRAPVGAQRTVVVRVVYTGSDVPVPDRRNAGCKWIRPELPGRDDPDRLSRAGRV